MRPMLSNLGWILSPTRMIVDHWKIGEPDYRALVLRRWNICLFWFELFICFDIIIISLFIPLNTYPFVAGLAVIYAYSRCNEITYAFYNDALRYLDQEKQTSTLNLKDRMKMAMKSYIGLVINFALLYYFLPFHESFKEPLKNFGEATYFSGVTVSTLGYGDIIPSHPVSRFIALYEVFAGILLITVSIATYIGASAKKGT